MPPFILFDPHWTYRDDSQVERAWALWAISVILQTQQAFHSLYNQPV